MRHHASRLPSASQDRGSSGGVLRRAGRRHVQKVRGTDAATRCRRSRARHCVCSPAARAPHAGSPWARRCRGRTWSSRPCSAASEARQNSARCDCPLCRCPPQHTRSRRGARSCVPWTVCSALTRRPPRIALLSRFPFGCAAKLGEQFPSLEDSGVLDELIPKKDKMVIAKWCAWPGGARGAAATPAAETLPVLRAPRRAVPTTSTWWW